MGAGCMWFDRTVLNTEGGGVAACSRVHHSTGIAYIHCVSIARRVAEQNGQESENAVLFSRKSFWHDTCRSLGECWTVTSQYTSLWKTAIQTIEGKHGACRHCTQDAPALKQVRNTASIMDPMGRYSVMCWCQSTESPSCSAHFLYAPAVPLRRCIRDDVQL